MAYNKEDVLQYVSEEDVKFIRLTFCDPFGQQKNISVLASELARAFEEGIPFDASCVSGFDRAVASDLLLFPEPDTLSVLPWRPSHGRVVRLFCDIRHPDGTPFEADCRHLLKEEIRRAAQKGILCDFGTDFEFYLFKTDENGDATTEPYDRAGYMDIAPLDKGENVRREICLTLEEMGIRPETSHHEVGPGQNEIDFRHSDALCAADNAVTFKHVVRTVATRNGACADFSPKPLAQFPGNGMHIHIFPHKADGTPLAPEPFAAGIMERITEITAFLNPTADSYQRPGQGKAPKALTWSRENRSQLIRIPENPNGISHLELRSPDGGANPYLAYTLLIEAGLCGVAEQSKLSPSEDMDSAENAGKVFKTLPQSIDEAKKLAAESDFVRRVLPEAVRSVYGLL